MDLTTLDTPILVPMSGGVDSTAVAWRYRDRPIMSFHLTVGISSPKAQVEAELAASRKIVGYLKRHGVDIEHEEFEHDPDDPLRLIPPRLAVAAYIGILLRQCPEITVVGGGGIAVDMTRQWVPRLSPSAKRLMSVLADRDDWRVETPFIKKTKVEVMSTLPPDLLELTFSCCWPVMEGSKWTQCGRCFKCDEVRF